MMKATHSQYTAIIPFTKSFEYRSGLLTKKIHGKQLFRYAIERAIQVFGRDHVNVITDSELIALACDRWQVAYQLICECPLYTGEFVTEKLEKIWLEYLTPELTHSCVLLSPIAPTFNEQDMYHILSMVEESSANEYVSVHKITHKLFGSHKQMLDSDINAYDADICRVYKKQKKEGLIPLFLREDVFEIVNDYSFWVAEKILQRKTVVFAVAGFPKIGMGHVYRSLMLAHSITDHVVKFVCTEPSALAAHVIADDGYEVIVAQDSEWQETILSLKPDLVINDILDTSQSYIEYLKNNDIKVVNFEDEGSGSQCCDLLISGLHEPDQETQKRDVNSRKLFGKDYFCLRDEFDDAVPNQFKEPLKNILVTFGGTDPSNYTAMVIQLLHERFSENRFNISIVVGPGYEHEGATLAYLQSLNVDHIRFTKDAKVMSREMGWADIAICSAGRTTFELAHMNVPSIVIAQNERENSHYFCREENGFVFLRSDDEGIKDKIYDAICRVNDPVCRKTLFSKMCQFDFSYNKAVVIERILSLLH